VFRELGAEVSVIGGSPDGLNINQQVGSTHPAALRAAVIQQGADLGIAFDGDGDRVLLVDSDGREVDGDDILYLIARDRQARGLLEGGVVGTLMSNFGLAMALEKMGIPFERAKVGDRYVMERMAANQWELGGESSGHIVCSHVQSTGDGIVSALQVLALMMREQQSLPALLKGLEKVPQSLVNVRLPAGANAKEVMASEPLQQAVTALESELGDEGRVLLRASGTEPLIRVMVEGRAHLDVDQLAGRLAEQVKALLK
jgi:phosphoglucosamine mutase